MDRRSFGKQTLGSLLTFSLLESIVAADALAEAVRPIAARWLHELNELGRSIKGNKLEQIEWQKQVEQLFSEIDLKEFLAYVDFDKLIQTVKFKERGERSFQATFPKVEGLPTELVFGHQMFALRQGQSVVPHGHNNMATAFLILQGQFEGKHYDRLEDHKDHFIIRPTIDRSFGVGECSTVSDHKDNIHWFKATTETAYIFNIHVLNIDPSINRSGRVYLDPFGEPLAGGLIKAKRLQSAEAYRQFG